VALNSSQKADILAILTHSSSLNSIVIPALFPRVLQLPLTGSILIPSSNEYVSIEMSLISEIDRDHIDNKTFFKFSEYWIVSQVNQSSQSYLFSGEDGIQIVAVSVPVPSSFLSGLATAGIIGLYVGIVLSVGKFLRLYVAGLTQRIIYEDLPYPDELIVMCEDVFMARKDRDLVLEEELYTELIQLYRSPERIILETQKPKQQ